MNKNILGIAFLTLTLALPALALAGDKGNTSNGPWIHIEVREHDGDGATVNVNLPISLADVALKMAQEKSGDRSHFRFEGEDFTVEDMREMWAEVRRAGDAEFVTVKDGDETVSVSRRGESVFVNVDGDDGAVLRLAGEGAPHRPGDRVRSPVDRSGGSGSVSKENSGTGREMFSMRG